MTPLEIALKEYGNESFAGLPTNPDVLKYFTETGATFVHDDETPWCAAFMNWVFKQANIETPNKLLARSYENFGHPTVLQKLGDVAIFWRVTPESGLGHVGFFIRETDKLIYVLGGNEDSAVKIKPFPKTQLIGFVTY